MTILYIIGSLVFLFAGFAFVDHFFIGSKKAYDATGAAGGEFWLLRTRKRKNLDSERQLTNSVESVSTTKKAD